MPGGPWVLRRPGRLTLPGAAFSMVPGSCLEVEIEAARQLVSCIIGGISAAAQVSVMAAAWPNAIQGFLSLVITQFVTVADFLFAFVGLV